IKKFTLKQTLDKFYAEFNFKERLKHDPIEFPHRYSHPEDIEVTGFIASCFAYGKVELFKPVIEQILKPCGNHPANFIKGFDLKRDKKYLKGISYRFNKEEDVLSLICVLGAALNEWGSLKNLFYYCDNPSASPLDKGRIEEDEDIRKALIGFVDYFLSKSPHAPFLTKRNTPLDPLLLEGKRPGYGLKQFFPSPETGSACKRMNLFLRWMVRTKDIDFGVWDNIPPSKLIIPLDVHIARISRCLGLTKRKSSDWKTAKEITEALKKLDPEDPLKYDFALCHHGISRLCRGGRFKDTCSTCKVVSC
ncbi:MAG: TIGR02757 family protein, partial [Nitrospirae bacterium]|nr:TIGR02757 family protein [Nitrospirota bacterium]